MNRYLKAATCALLVASTQAQAETGSPPLRTYIAPARTIVAEQKFYPLPPRAPMVHPVASVEASAERTETKSSGLPNMMTKEQAQQIIYLYGSD